jgi:hypothetical protein
LPAAKRQRDFYAATVFKIGNDVASNSAAQDASSLILQQLENQRSASPAFRWMRRLRIFSVTSAPLKLLHALFLLLTR